MAYTTYKEASRANFGIQHGDSSAATFTNEQINIGSLQRIADATEVMAKNYIELQRELEKYKRWYQEEVQRVSHRDKIIAGLRGHITKLKKKF